MIDWVKPSPDALWESTNHTQINKKGMDLNLTLNIKNWFGINQPMNSLNAGLMLLDQREQMMNLYLTIY